jgi:non-heme chloroperoxidase
MNKLLIRNILKKLLLTILSTIVVFLAMILIMIAFFPPKPPPVLESIAAPFRSVDFSDLPLLSHYSARDGAMLAYRAYPARRPGRTVVLIHGSSGSSRSMHPLARYLHERGFTAYSLDIRGHGMSGRRGDIEYSGQLENDLEDFVNRVLKGHRGAALVGFSSGGGFALRFAAGPDQKLFSRYVLLSPFLSYNAPTVRPGADKWASASVLRIIGISLLGPVGEKLFGSLPVIDFAVDPRTAQYQTPQYSFRLLENFRPHYDYVSDMAAAKQPMTVLVGEKDELFNPKAFKPLFVKYRPGTRVIVVPGVGHITLTTDMAGITAIAKVLAR